MRFSVIVPAYDRQDYLDEALASVLAQTCGDWECVVVDDASPSGPLRVPQDPRFRLVRNEVNLGIPGSRNVGLRLARGERVCFLDHDDTFTPDRLALDLGHGLVVINPGPLGDFAPQMGKVTVDRSACLQFDEDFAVSDDVDWWLRMTRAQPFTLVEGDCHTFRAHEMSAATGREARLRDSLLLLRKHAEFYRRDRRARAFRWARVAALSDRRGQRLAAVARSVLALPTRYGLIQAVRLAIPR